MEIHFTARHFEIAPELRENIVRKLEKLGHVNDRILEARVILTAENYRHIAEITLLARRHEFVAREESADMHTSADMVVEKLEQQLRRFKEKRLSRGRRNGRKTAADVAELGSAGSPVISRREIHEDPVALTVDEALEQLDDDGGEVLVFQNRETRRTSVLYRRQDGTFGLIEPAG